VGDLVRFKLGPRCGLRRGTSATAWYELGCAVEATDPARAMAAYERALRLNVNLTAAREALAALPSADARGKSHELPA